ncbi:MAG: protein kinase domain-containing protein, partial [Nannocystaceae bacterium]
MSSDSGLVMPAAADAMTLDDELARQRLFTSLLDIEEQPVRVGRFRIEGRLGQGGMGTVWVAHDEELLRPVALKFLRSGRRTNPQVLIKEAQSLAKINHPNVVAVYDVGSHRERVWLAMELVAGHSLRKAIGSEADTGIDARL